MCTIRASEDPSKACDRRRESGTHTVRGKGRGGRRRSGCRRLSERKCLEARKHRVDCTLAAPENADVAEQVVSHAMTVNTNGAKDVASRKHGAHSAMSGFAIVRVDERKAVRIVGAIHMSVTGTVTQDEDVMAAKVEVLPGKHWL